MDDPPLGRTPEPPSVTPRLPARPLKRVDHQPSVENQLQYVESAALAGGAGVAAFVRDHVERPAPEPEPRRLYTAREIGEATGIKAATIRAERRCAADDLDRSREYLRAPYAQPLEVGALSARLRLRRPAGDPPEHPVRTGPTDQREQIACSQRP